MKVVNFFSVFRPLDIDISRDRCIRLFTYECEVRRVFSWKHSWLVPCDGLSAYFNGDKGQDHKA